MSPRLWLFVWGGIGTLLLGYVVIAASIKPGPQVSSACKASAKYRHPSLITGEMADFVYATNKRSAPAVEFQYEDQTLSLADFRRKAVLVNFWATWCAPCLKELPSLDALQGLEGSAKFEVVAIAADPKGPEAAEQFLEKLNIKNLKLYADPIKACQCYWWCQCAACINFI